MPFFNHKSFPFNSISLPFAIQISISTFQYIFHSNFPQIALKFTFKFSIKFPFQMPFVKLRYGCNVWRPYKWSISIVDWHWSLVPCAVMDNRGQDLHRNPIMDRSWSKSDSWKWRLMRLAMVRIDENGDWLPGIGCHRRWPSEYGLADIMRLKCSEIDVRITQMDGQCIHMLFATVAAKLVIHEVWGPRE